MKMHPSPTARWKALLLAAALAAPPLPAADYTWNGGTTGTWDTSTANWTGAGTTWVNGAGNNALFNTSADITLGHDITGGTLTVDMNSTFRGPLLGGYELQVNALTSTAIVSFADDISLSIISMNGLSGGVQNFGYFSRLNVNATGAVSGGEQNFYDYSALNANAANAMSDGFQFFNDNSVLNANVANALSGGFQDFYDNSALNANAANAVSGVQDFYDNSTLDANAVSGGFQDFYDNSALNANAANAVSGGTQSFYDNSALDANSANAVSGGIQHFNHFSELNADAANAVSGGFQDFYNFSSLNANAANAVSGGDQDFYNFSSLNAYVASAVSVGEQEFYDTSALNANAANAVSGGEQNFYANSVLNANAANAVSGGEQYFATDSDLNVNAANAVSGGTQTFYHSTALNAAAVNAVSGGTQTFYHNSTLNAAAANAVSGGEQFFYLDSTLDATAANAVSGGTQNFTDGSRLIANASNSVSGGTQNFYDSSDLYTNVANSLSGGTQNFYDSSDLHAGPNAVSGGTQNFYDGSSLNAITTNAVSGGSITLFQDANVFVGNTNALGAAVPVTFNNSLGGIGGRLWLNGNSTTVGTLSSAAPGSGLIENDALLAAVLATHSAVDSTFSGIIQDGAGGGSLGLVKDGPGTLTLSSANTFTGGTTLNTGTLRTTNAAALGGGDLTQNAGILAPSGPLALSSLAWNGGQIALAPTGGDLLQIANAFTNGGSGGTFLINPAGLNASTYTLATFASTDFTLADFSAELGGPNVQVQYTLLLLADELQLTIFSAQAWGPLLQNSAPVLIPTFADFFVQGQVRTGTVDENNTIKSLHFDPGSNLQVYNNLTVTSGNFTVSGGKATIQGGTVLVPGEFNKFGPGTLDARSNFVVNGNSYIHSGALAVNGTFQTPLLHVLGGGTLMGNGIVIGNVLNGGAVAPGNSIGLLTILGNYTQQKAGTLQIEVGSVYNHDLLVVSGRAVLDGTLEITSLGYNAKYGDQIPFLRAGNITGKFDVIEMPDPKVNRGRFLNLGQVGVLLVAPTSYTLVAETPNQSRVASALDHWIGIEEGDIGTVTLALDLLREEHYPQAFEAIMPGFHDAALSTAIELSHSQGQLLHQQLSARRLGQRASQSQPGQRVSTTVNSGKSTKSVKAVAAPQAQPDSEDYRWSTWFQGSGLFSQGGLSLAPGESFESGTFITGADYALADNFAVGIFAGYGEGWGDYDHRGKIDLERILFGGYATIDIGNFYLNGALGIGTVDYNIKRPIQFATLNRTASSEPNGHEFFALLGGGYDFRKGNWTFGPQASIQYSKVALDTFSETGADSLNLQLKDPENDSLRSHLGARVAFTIQASERVALIPELRAFWQHEFLDGDSLNAGFDSGDSPNFIYESERDDKDALFLGAGLGLQIGPRFYANLYYNVDLGRNDPNHNVSLSATLKF